jgi:hypothetical protein
MKPRNLLLLFCFSLISNGFSAKVDARVSSNRYTIETQILATEESSAKPCHNTTPLKLTQLNAVVGEQPDLVCDCCEDLSCMSLGVCSMQLSTAIPSKTATDIQQENIVYNNSIQVTHYLSLPKEPLDHKPKK